MRSAAVSILLGILLGLPAGCLRKASTTPDYTETDVTFIVQAGAYVYAVVQTSSYLPSAPQNFHQNVLIIDPLRIADTSGAGGGGAVVASQEAVAGSWGPGSLNLNLKLDETTLLASRLNDAGTASELVTISLANPLAPTTTVTYTFPPTFVGSPVMLFPDGHVLLSMTSLSDAPVSRVMVVDPRTGVVLSSTDRLNCYTWQYMNGQVFCAGPDNKVRVYAYSTDGGLGADVTSALVPNVAIGVSYLADPTHVYFLAGTLTQVALYRASVNEGGTVTVGPTIELPPLAGGMPGWGVNAVLPLGDGRAVLSLEGDPNNGLVVHDFRSGADVFTVADVGPLICYNLAPVPALGPDYFLAGTLAKGVMLYRLDAGGFPRLLGSVKPR